MENFEVLESFESAAVSVGVDPAKLPILAHMPERFQTNIVSGHKLDIISEAAWKAAGIELDWDNSGQRKYYAWWDMRKKVSSGVGLSFDGLDCVSDYAVVGSRRVFPSREVLEYVVNQHFQLFVDTLVIQEK